MSAPALPLLSPAAVAALPPTAAGAGQDLEIRDLGLLGYDAALELQLARLEALRAGQAPPALFLVEHPPVVTLGVAARPDSLLCPQKELQRRGIALVRSRRGGDATCHFPGQLTVYAILRLWGRPRGLPGLVHDLEEVLLRLLRRWDIPGERRTGLPGVWVRGRKIASVGLGLRHGITFHGLALNVARNLELFSLIRPCGLAGVEITAMELEREALGLAPVSVALDEVKHACGEEFRRVFPNV